MTARTLALRFDIDTLRCVREGIPGLLQIAREEDCQFTFFANMGRSIERCKAPPKTGTSHGVTKLSSREKLGLMPLLATLLFNPRLGAVGEQILQQVAAAGHELGLHGGHNHGAWHHRASTWTDVRVRHEVEAGLAGMQAAGLPRPAGFASPGFTHPGGLDPILRSLGFSYVADRHAPDAEALTPDRDELTAVNTNVLGMPGNVGYIEWCMARRMTPAAMLDDLLARLDHRQTAVLYDHPLVAGIGGREHMRALIRGVREHGWTVTTIATLIATDRERMPA